MATRTLKLVKGRRIRLTRVDGCGRPVFGENSQAVSKGFISVALTANTTDTDEVNLTNAAGERCIYIPAESSIASYSVEIAFCDVDPELFSLATGQQVVLDAAGNAIGLSVDTAIDTTASGFALELWAGVGDDDACASGALSSYGYFLLPFLKGGIIGDFTVENDAVTFTLTGATTRDGNAWGVGPYNNVFTDAEGDLTPLPEAISTTAALWWAKTNAAPPEPFVGSRPLLDPSENGLTALAATAAGQVATFTPTPADIIAPAWYDFGDGTWDYLASGAMAATTHTYTNPGTYTVKASTNGTWVTTTVTVPGA